MFNIVYVVVCRKQKPEHNKYNNNKMYYYMITRVFNMFMYVK